MVKKSKGFSWGAAGVSTALFTGVVMADLIKKAKPRRKARFVCMEGADKLVRSSALALNQRLMNNVYSPTVTMGPLSNSTGSWTRIEE